MSNKNININVDVQELFLKKITELTGNYFLQWMSIPEYFRDNQNEQLRRKIISETSYAYRQIGNSKQNLNEYRSYIANLNGGNVIILCFSKNTGETKLDLYVQTDPYSMLVELSGIDKSSLSALYSRVSTSSYNVERFMDTIINS